MNTLKNLLQTLRRYKTGTLLNIFGLTVAFAAFFILMAQVKFELTFDRHYPGAERIYQVTVPLFYDESAPSSFTISRLDGEKLGAASPAVQAKGCVSIRSFPPGTVYDYENGVATRLDRTQCYSMAAGMLKVFGLECVEGSFERFGEPNTVILSEETARLLYGDHSAIGRSVVLNQNVKNPRQVVGIYKDLPANGTFGNGAIYDLKDTHLNARSEWGYCYYVKLDSRKNAEQVRQAMIAELKTLRKEVKPEVLERLRLIPLHELYFSSEIAGPFHGNRATVYSLLAVAVLIVLIAMINFINFSVALVPLRIRSINTQKVLGRTTGALRRDAVIQAGATALIAFVIAIPVIQAFASSSWAGIASCKLFPMQNLPLLAATGLIAVATGVIAGIYPACYSTSFPPALVLKGSFGLSPKGRRIRTVLIAFQYFISIVLIISAISIREQNRFLKTYDMGFSRENILIVQLPDSVSRRHSAFGDKLKSNPAIRDVAFSDNPPVAPGGSLWGTQFRGRDIQFNTLGVTSNFISLTGLKIIEGRNFTEADERKTTCSVIFNRKAQQRDSLTVGEELSNNMPIVGIAQDFHFQPLYNGIEPMALVIYGTGWKHGGNMRFALIKTTLAETGPASAFIKRTIREFDPQAKTEIAFLDEFIGDLYKKETHLSQQLTLFSLLSILIALIGIFGLVLFETQYRRREIAVRRVFGATVTEILMMFNKSLVRTVLICFVIAAPVAWYVVHRWLESFAYRFRMGVWIFLLTLAIVLAVTILTVVLQSYRAATENPAKSIKSE